MAYMNTGWSGPSPLPVVEAIKERFDREMTEGSTSPEVQQAGKDIQDKAREAVARLLNATPEEICLTKNTTEGINFVINGLPWRQGDEIITCSLEHRSVLTPSYYQQHRHGAVVKVLTIATDESQEGILEKIEAAVTERTKLIFLSHIEYSCGLRMPVKEIRQLIRDRGVLLLLDGAQTAGHIALDMRDLDCDFYSIPGQKWLLGPEGTGALYMRRELIAQVEPVHVAGKAALPAESPYEFQPNESTIEKFLLTSTSAPLQTGLLKTIEFIQEIGVGEIEERNLDLAGRLKQALRETPGVEVLSPLDRQGSSGLVTFNIDGLGPEEAVSRLWEGHRILVRKVSFPLCIRASLHFFNTEEEVDQVVDAVRGMVS
jgi:L-cysteine/cystine lyase